MSAGWECTIFNVKDGYLEGIVRGHKGALLRVSDYNNLAQCETLDDVKLHLAGTDYGPYLANEPSPLQTSTIVDKCTMKLVDNWNHMRANADEPLGKFLDYCTYGHMIDNVVLIVTGTLHERDVQELLEKCHPLGMFDSMATLAVASSMRELYRLVLVDTPLAPYFSENLSSEDLDEMNIEIMRNTLYKAYLDDFAQFCDQLGGITAEVMHDMLAFEADRRALNITMNSIGTELTRDDRKKLYSGFGLLYPHGHLELSVAEDFDQIRAAMEKVPQYGSIFNQLGFGEGQMLDKLMYEEEVKKCVEAFEQQFHYGVFYSYLKLVEQEIRNLMWVSECVAQDQKGRIGDGMVYLF
eukprot:TRINITY_DN8684_c0_g1_i1.p2 TRINITY_DN8684_c0_g1~~TRINITY_DN8684_c0_g1_i1.p2  ORF type:complete len:353 (-),score=70.76 TRINITY_DN8684_c0_g1_i1:473-1531(-)